MSIGSGKICGIKIQCLGLGFVVNKKTFAKSNSDIYKLSCFWDEN